MVKDESKIVRILSRKGCKIGGQVIDIEKANDLGNKTWGYIDYLVNELHYSLVGRKDYQKTCKRFYPSNESPVREQQDTIKIHPAVIQQKIKDGKLYHAYNVYPEKLSNPTNNNTTLCSEYQRLEGAKQFVNGYDRRFARKMKYERIHIKEVKKTAVFFNDVVFQSEHERPIKNVRKEQPKSQLQNAA